MSYRSVKLSHDMLIQLVNKEGQTLIASNSILHPYTRVSINSSNNIRTQNNTMK